MQCCLAPCIDYEDEKRPKRAIGVTGVGTGDVPHDKAHAVILIFVRGKTYNQCVLK